MDIDLDGDLDIVASSLQRLKIFENLHPASNFVRFKLRATQTQHHALGAEVIITADGTTQRDYVKLTAGFQSQVPLELHFGLGNATSIEDVTIKWPSGGQSNFTKLKSNQRYSITEGQNEIQTTTITAWPSPKTIDTTSRLSLDQTAKTVAGDTAQLRSRRQASVINFWAPWCEPCQRELPELAALEKSFGKEIEFIGVSVEKTKIKDVEAAIKKFRLSYAQFYANDKLVQSFFGADGEIPLPSTFVFSKEGQLMRVFTRAVGKEDLHDLLSDLKGDPLNFEFIRPITESYLLQGKHQEALALLLRAHEERPKDLRILSQLGNTFAIMGQNEKALSYLKQAVSLAPKSDYAWYVLGVSYKKLKRTDEALKALRKAFKLAPNKIQYAMSLGATLSSINELNSAVKIFEAATQIDPKHVLAWVNLGKAHGLLKNKAAAKKALKQALKLDPDNRKIQALHQHFHQ